MKGATSAATDVYKIHSLESDSERRHPRKQKIKARAKIRININAAGTPAEIARLKKYKRCAEKVVENESGY